MSSALLALILSGTLGLGSTPGTEAPPDAVDAVRVRLDVDTSDLGADQAVGEAIAEAVTGRLADLGIVVDGGQAVAISIRVKRFNPKAVADFFVEVQIMRGGEVIDVLETSGCAKCIDDFLVEHVAARVPEIGERVRRLQEDLPQTQQSPGDPVEPPTPDTTPTGARAEPTMTEPAPQQRLEVALIASGSATCAVGLGTLLGGVLVWADGNRIDNAGSQPQQVETSDRRGLGYGLIGAGTVLVAGGSALIVVGSLRRNKGRREHAQLAPLVGPSAWGASVSGRF